MKKRLEAELISIAHRILKLKNKSEVDQLYKETQKLYETLSVLKFYQDNFESVKTDLAENVLEEKIAQHPEEETTNEVVSEVKQEIEEPKVEVEVAPEVAPEPIVEVVEEPTQEVEEELEMEIAPEAEVKETLAFEPIFELEVEEDDEHEVEVADEVPAEAESHIDSELEEEVEPAETVYEMSPDAPKVKEENFLSDEFRDPVFVKPNEVSLFDTTIAEEISEPKSPVVHETSNKSIAIGLNDRIGFVKHLFDESNEDFNRVLSQLNTFDSFEEAKNFIDDMVKPDYNNWQGNEDYAERFMELIENKFQ